LKAKIISLPETGSTNTYAIGLLSKERPEEGCVVITHHQTQGKGTDTNTWESETGKNLTFSVILYPDFKADQQFVLNKAISLAICDFIAAELPQSKIIIKWPNDIYIGNKKVCGILIQNSVIGNRLDYVVVGIGLNVNQTIFTSDAPNPVSLKMVTGRDYDLDELLQKLLNFIYEKYAQLKPETSQKIENEYLKKLYRLMEWHEFILKGNKTLARITGTNTYGQLELETENRQVFTCDLKEVKFII
jgi:BirA family biotin operon repressor/biotin-[acetyl-CoA-carboxylase] ligase